MEKFIKIIGTALSLYIGKILGDSIPWDLFSALGFVMLMDVITAIIREFLINKRNGLSIWFSIRSKLISYGVGVKFMIICFMISFWVNVKSLGYDPSFLIKANIGMFMFFELYSILSNIQCAIIGKRLPESEVFNVITPLIKKLQKTLLSIIEKMFDVAYNSLDIVDFSKKGEKNEDITKK